MSDPHTMRIRNASQDPDWRTPPELMKPLLRVFPIQIDLAATLSTRVVPLYLGPDQPAAIVQDALATSWMHAADDWGVVPCGFLNPPYSLSKIRELKKEWAARPVASPEDAAYLAAVYTPQIRALRIEAWAQKAYEESLQGFTTIGVFPYAPQTRWFRQYVLGHAPRPKATEQYGECTYPLIGWSGHAALDCWILAHRISYLRPDGSPAANANVNSCIIHWGPNPGFVGPWVPSFRSWSYR